MTGKKDTNDFDFEDSNDFDFGDEVTAKKETTPNIIKRQNTINEKEVERRAIAQAAVVKTNTITERDIKDAEEDDFDDFDFGIGNDEAEKNIEDDEITDEDILNAMTYYVATYAESIGGTSGIFTRYMALTRERDKLGKKDIEKMVVFLSDILSRLANDNFDVFDKSPNEEQRMEFIKAFGVIIFGLAERRNWN